MGKQKAFARLAYKTNNLINSNLPANNIFGIKTMIGYRILSFFTG